MHIFGCSAYYHVTESKLDPRAKKAIFLGFSGGVKGYRLWCSESKKVILSRDVTFDEFGMLQQEKSQEKEKQSGDAQQVELETLVIPIKTVQTILLKEIQIKVQMKRMQQLQQPHNKNPLQLVNQKELSRNLLGIVIWWLMHFR